MYRVPRVILERLIFEFSKYSALVYDRSRNCICFASVKDTAFHRWIRQAICDLFRPRLQGVGHSEQRRDYGHDDMLD
jgi:hypothetical protein